MRIPIRLQYEIARLHFHDPAISSRSIARSLDISDHTVRHLRELLGKANLSWDDIRDLDHDQWQTIVGTKDSSSTAKKDRPDWGYIRDEMQLPDATLRVLWVQWKETCPGGVGFTEFTAEYRAYVKSLAISMRQVHQPGVKLFVDFAGRTFPITDPKTGNVAFEAQIFVAALGYSSFIYVEACASQQIPDWINAHVHCFESLGGSTKWVVCDRLKSAVPRANRDFIYISEEYREALKHYDSASLPARARRPKDKAVVEVSVQIAQRWVLFVLRHRVFFSLEELNAEIRRLVAELNDRPFKKRPGSRRTRFETVERQTLRPLPQQAYEFARWRHSVAVGADHHLEHERAYYSVPSQFALARVDLRVTVATMEIHHKGRRISMHALVKAGEVSSLREHRPIGHLTILDGDPDSLLKWAKTVGENTERMFNFHLNIRRDPANGVRAARKLKALAEEHSPQRFEEVCRYALPLQITALQSLVSILKDSVDRRPQAEVRTSVPHDNIRGAQYFGEEE